MDALDIARREARAGMIRTILLFAIGFAMGWIALP